MYCAKALCMFDTLFWLKDQIIKSIKGMLHVISCSAQNIEISSVSYASFQPRQNLCQCPGWSFNSNTTLGGQPAISLSNENSHISLWEMAPEKWA